MSCRDQGNILSFSCWQSDTCLLLAPPAYSSTTDLEQISRCWISVIKVASPVCIRKSHTVAILLGFEDKPKIYCAFQVSHDPLHCDPVTSSWICWILYNIADFIQKVRPSSHRQIQQTSNCWLINVLVKWIICFHFWNLSKTSLFCFRTYTHVYSVCNHTISISSTLPHQVMVHSSFRTHRCEQAPMVLDLLPVDLNEPLFCFLCTHASQKSISSDRVQSKPCTSLSHDSWHNPHPKRWPNQQCHRTVWFVHCCVMVACSAALQSK